MKKTTFYTLLGCAGMAVTAGSGYGLFQIHKGLDEKRNIAEHAYQEARKKREDLTGKLQNCSTVDECHAAFSRYGVVEEELINTQRTYLEAEKESTLDSNWGFYSYIIMLAGIVAASSAFAGASKERSKESFEGVNEGHQKMFDVYGGKQ